MYGLWVSEGCSHLEVLKGSGKGGAQTSLLKGF